MAITYALPFRSDGSPVDRRLFRMLPITLSFIPDPTPDDILDAARNILIGMLRAFPTPSERLDINAKIAVLDIWIDGEARVLSGGHT